MEHKELIAKIKAFLDDYFATDRSLEDCLTCLALSKDNDELWGSIANSIFESELLYPLSHVTEYIRRYKKIEDYLPLIHLIKEPEIVKREYLFTALRGIQRDNPEGVQKVLHEIYGADNIWDALDSAIALNNFREFEKLVGSDNRFVDLKRIVCYFQSIRDREVVIFRKLDYPCLIETKEYYEVSDTATLEDLKQLAKNLLSTCAMLMLSTKEEQHIKRIYNNPLLTNELSFEGIRYYVRIRSKKASIASDEKVEEVEEFKSQTTTDISTSLYTRKDVIELFKINPGTLNNWVINGTLNKIKIGGRVYFDRTEVDEQIDKNRRK